MHNRRDFIEGLGGATLSVLAMACATNNGPLTTALSSTPNRSTRWDDGWTTRLGKHRTVFDVSELEAVPGVGQIPPVMDAWRDVLGVSDRDLGFVLVVRHLAVGMLVTDAIWAKYDVSADLKHNDPTTKAPYKRNPFTELLTTIQLRGVVVLGCHSAVMGLGGLLAARAGGDAAAVRQELVANLLAGVILQPNGLYALSRAQDAGCGFMR